MPAAGPWDLVVGHSLGGAVAVKTAAADPGWTKSVLLIDPVLVVAEDRHDDLIATLRGDLDNLDPAALLSAHPRWHLEDAVQKVNAARVASPYLVERTVRDNPDWQLEEAAAGLQPRTRALAGDPALDASFPVTLAERIAARNPRFTFVVVDGAGHSVHRDDPDRVVAEALALLP